ncbi:signal peptide protein [Caballeronia peredens]|nr:signal peptide protein [Caballeronia peredens]
MKRRAIAEIALIAAALLAPLVQAEAAGDTRAAPPSVRPDDSAAANGDVAEFEALIAAGKITDMRKTLNGSYGAMLSYYPEMMIYYVALFQQNKFWRVFKTQNDVRAEAVYADFSKSTVTLADAEIRRIKLEAETAFADRQIAAQQERANRLQADLDVARSQQGQVAAYQQEQQNAIRELRTGQAAAQAQLRALQLRVQELQKQADGDLPSPAK